MSVAFRHARLVVFSALLLIAPLSALLCAPGGSAQTTTFSISGKVDDTGLGNGNPIAGVTMTLTNALSGGGTVLQTQQTDAGGNYTFATVAAGGTYSVNPSKQGFSFQPTSRGYSNLQQNWSSQNFAGEGTTPTPTPTPSPSPSPTPDPTPSPTPSPTPDPTLFVQFSAANYDTAEGNGSAELVVTLSAAQSSPRSVQYATASGTASGKGDFTASFGVLTFAPGETSKAARVLLTDDRYAESNETFTVALSNPSGATLGATASAAVTIVDNDVVSGQSPVRLGPDFDINFFVRQHYLDFLNREPDAGGLAFWTGQFAPCDQLPEAERPSCRQVRSVNVSAAFFLSIEFQQTGYLVYRFYKAAYGDATSPGVPGTVPVVRLGEFLPDTQRIGRGVQVGVGEWQAQLEANKTAYAEEFVSRPRFLAAYPAGLTPEQFVDGLNQQAGGALSDAERNALVEQLRSGQTTRAGVVRAVAEDQTLARAEFNRAFVLMQYYGYLRRNPDDPQDRDFGGWRFWLDQLERYNGDFQQAQMVRAFIESIEYRERFGL